MIVSSEVLPVINGCPDFPVPIDAGMCGGCDNYLLRQCSAGALYFAAIRDAGLNVGQVIDDSGNRRFELMGDPTSVMQTEHGKKLSDVVRKLAPVIHECTQSICLGGKPTAPSYKLN